MNIGEAAKAAGLSNKMLRYYESIGLLPPAKRSYNGYRQYDDKDVHILRFIRQARNLGFGLEPIKSLLSLWQDQRRESREVKALAENHIRELEDKIREMTQMLNLLKDLTEHCQGDNRPDCPILSRLASEKEAGRG